MTRQIITVDIAPEVQSDRRLKVSQYDVGRPLGVYIVRNGEPVDCSGYTAQLYVFKPDRTYYEHDCEIAPEATSLVTWETGEQETVYAGACLAEIRIMQDGINIGTANFVEWIEESPTDLSRTSKSEVQSLMALVSQAEDAAKAAKEAVDEMDGIRIMSLDTTALAVSGTIINAVGIPVYVDDVTAYEDYGITETGWYVFARIFGRGDTKVTEDTTVTGAAGSIVTVGAEYVDLAVCFEVAAMSSIVTISWGDETDRLIFNAPDLAVRNLDYRTTFYVYDIAPFATWEYALTTDETFVADKKYYTLADDVYTLAEVTAGEAVPAYYTKSEVYTQATVTVGDAIPANYYTLADEVYTQATGVFEDGVTYYTKSEVYTRATGIFEDGVTYYTKSGDEYSEAEVTVGDAIPAYYNHSKLTFSGMARNVTYQFDEIIDCPQEYVLPEIEDDGHGAWFEIRLRHAGSYSSTLVVPEGVKIATEHTQAETAGMNMIDLHYMDIDGIKIWRFMNTHSSIPST